MLSYGALFWHALTQPNALRPLFQYRGTEWSVEKSGFSHSRTVNVMQSNISLLVKPLILLFVLCFFFSVNFLPFLYVLYILGF